MDKYKVVDTQTNLVNINMDLVDELRQEKKWSWKDLADESCLSLKTLMSAQTRLVRPFVAEFLSTGLSVPVEMLVKNTEDNT